MFSMWNKKKEENERKAIKEINNIAKEAFDGDGLLALSAVTGVTQHLAQAKQAYDNGNREEAYKASLEAASLLEMMNKPKEAEKARNLLDTLDKRKNSICRIM